MSYIGVLEDVTTTASATAPESETEGDIWYDTGEQRLKVYSTSQGWVTLATNTDLASISATEPVTGTVAPTDAVTGDFWYDTGENKLKVYDSTQGWVTLANSDDAVAASTIESVTQVTQVGEPLFPTDYFSEAYAKFGYDGASEFGQDISLSSDGNTMVVGSQAWNRQGGVYTYTRSGDQWVQQGSVLTAFDASPDTQIERYGQIVSLSGDGQKLVVGSKIGLSTSQVYKAYTYQRNGTAWDLLNSFEISETSPVSMSGQVAKISRDGNTLIAGLHAAFPDINGKGAIITYDWNSSSSSWVKSETFYPIHNTAATGNIDVHAAATPNISLRNLSFSDDLSRLAVSIDNYASEYENAGAVFVFARSGNTWTKTHEVYSPYAYRTAGFGESVCLSADGNILFVTQLEEIYNSTSREAGRVFVFDLVDNEWRPRPFAITPSIKDDYAFGEAVAYSNGTLVCSAEMHIKSGVYAGSVFTYTFNETNVYTQDNNTKILDVDGNFHFVNNKESNTVISSSGDADLSGELSSSSLNIKRQRVLEKVKDNLFDPYHITGNRFGRNLKISKDGRVLAVASKGSSPKVSIFDWDDSSETWVHRGQTNGIINSFSQTVTSNDENYMSVSMNGDGSILVIGYPERFDSSSSGHVYIYEFNQTTSSYEVDQIIEGSSTYFGYGVDINSYGNILVVGDMGQSTVTTYRRDSSGLFSFYMNLDSPLEGPDNFGCSVSIDAHGRYLVVGNPSGTIDTSLTGQAYLFNFNTSNGQWNLTYTFDPIRLKHASKFGEDVEISTDGQTVLVCDFSVGNIIESAEGDQSYYQGGVYMYKRDRLSSNSWDLTGIFMNNLGASELATEQVNVTIIPISSSKNYVSTISASLSTESNRLVIGSITDGTDITGETTIGSVSTFEVTDFQTPNSENSRLYKLENRLRVVSELTQIHGLIVKPQYTGVCLSLQGNNTTRGQLTDLHISRTGDPVDEVGRGSSIQLENVTKNTGVVLEEYDGGLRVFTSDDMSSASNWQQQLYITRFGLDFYNDVDKDSTEAVSLAGIGKTTTDEATIQNLYSKIKRISFVGRSDQFSMYAEHAAAELDSLNAIFELTDNGSTQENFLFRTRRSSNDGATKNILKLGMEGSYFSTYTSNSLEFYRGNISLTDNYKGLLMGSITNNGSSLSYNTTSDYRLKENIIEVENAVDKIKSIPVKTFNYAKTPDQTIDGFIAHEVQKIVPYAVTGIKDEVDDKGDPVYQQVDYSKIVPLLTAALQESIKRIEVLESEIHTLKNKYNNE